MYIYVINKNKNKQALFKYYLQFYNYVKYSNSVKFEANVEWNKLPALLASSSCYSHPTWTRVL